MSHLNGSKQHICPNGRPDCGLEGWFCGDCLHKILLSPEFLDFLSDKSEVGVDLRQKFPSDSLDKPVICELCKNHCGSNEECDWCIDFLKSFETGGGDVPSMQGPQQTSKLVARGGSGGGSACEAHDVQPTQEFKVSSSGPICEGCLQSEVPPFTKGQVENVHAEMKFEFIPSKTGRIFELVVLLHSLLIASIDWTMHNCAFSTLVLMLSSSNAGMNSINQQTFAGYILAVIINRLQESGKCDPILLEVFRLELSILSGNSSWSNWSELVEFQDLYKVCVRHNIILDNEVEFVLPNDDGSYNVEQTLNGKCGSTLLQAYKWRPSMNVFANGILSLDLDSKFRISAVVLHYDDHFSIVVFSQGIWLIDGKGKRTGEFKAESSIRKLTIEQSQELFASHGVFYFLEEIPFVYETLNLFGRQGLPPRKVFYGKKWYFLYDDRTMICETTGITVNLQRTIFVNDNFGNHFLVFPVPPPPPPAPCSQVAWALPPTPPPLLPVCGAQVARALPPPQAACAQVSQVFEHKRSSITVNDIVVSPGKWICSIDPEYSGIVEKTPHPKYPTTMMEVYFYQTESRTTLGDLVKFINFIKSIQ